MKGSSGVDDEEFHVAAEYLNLDEEIYNVLKSSVEK